MYENDDYLNMISSCCFKNEVDVIEISKDASPSLIFFDSLLNSSDTRYSQDIHIVNIMKEVLPTVEEDIRFLKCSLICQDSFKLNFDDKGLYAEHQSRLGWIINLLKNEQLLNYINDTPVVIDNNKPVVNACIINMWEGASIDKAFRFIKEAIEDHNYLINMVENSKDCELVIDGITGNEKIVNKAAFKISYIGEPFRGKINGYDLALGFEHLPNQPNYLRLPIYYLYYGELITSEYQRTGDCNPNKAYFACFLVSNSNKNYAGGNGIKARDHMFESLSKYKPVTSGGRHLNNIGIVISHSYTFKFLSQCKFVIAYENSDSLPGYITEKPFQAYFAGSVPLYYTHPASISDINKEAVILAQDFKSEEDMIRHIIEVDNNDEKYCKIWNNSIITDPSLNYQAIKQEIGKRIEPFLSLMRK